MLYNLRGTIAKATPFTVDKTLSVEGASADAKATGDAIQKAKGEALQHSDDHANLKTNPHAVTAEQVGLGKVNNTSDMDKPVSTAQAQAIADAKKAGTDAQTIANNAKEAANNALLKTGGTMTGALSVLEPTEDSHASTKKYVDSKYFSGNVTLLASGWSETAPYKQTVSVSGVLESDKPHYCVVYSGVLETDITLKEAFAKVDDLDTSNGEMVFTCFEEKPEVDIPVQFEINR